MSKTVKHCMLTVCAPMPADPDFRFAREADVERLIDLLGNPAKAKFADRLDAAGIVHFVSLHVIRSRRPDERSFLVIEATGDGERNDVINALCEALGDELLVIFRRACGVRDLDHLRGFLKRHSPSPTQNFVRLWWQIIGLPFEGTKGLSVERIKEEDIIVGHARRAIDALAAKDAATKSSSSALAYLRKAAEEVGRNTPSWRSDPKQDDEPDLEFVDAEDAPWLKPRGEPTVVDYVKLSPGLLSPLLVALAAFWALMFWWFDFPDYLPIERVISATVAFALSIPLALVAIGFVAYCAYQGLRESEQRNKPNDLDPDPAVISKIMRLENNPASVQNHMISITEVIPEITRRNLTLPLAMHVIKMALERRLFRGGFLADIGTIHFARWVVLPGTYRLVFFSNYDGSWESYLEDFITKASVGLTGVWSNCVGFPKTKRLFMDGATDGDRFKRWARRSMMPTRFWYSAYPKLTAQQIRTNALICDGMRKVSTATDAEAWLELFDSIPRPEPTLEYDEIQKLVISSMKNLPEARCLAISFDKSTRANEWIQRLLEKNRITFAEQGEGHKGAAAFIALTATGMRKLGVEECGLDRPDAKNPTRVSFPTPFVVGMHDETRQDVLSDYDASAAKHWDWGGRKLNRHTKRVDDVDAVRIVYAPSDEAMQTVLAGEANLIEEFGLKCLHTVVMQGYGPNAATVEGGTSSDREPFGYLDGVSQPIMLKSAVKDPLHDVEAGEFILGYRDNRGFFPPTLLLPREKDKGDMLPGPPSRLPKRWPQFRRVESDGEEQSTRDLGRNGSFLVIRQLEQDVDGFNDWLQDVSAHIINRDRNNPANATLIDDHVELAAAKVMGRWRSGASYARYSDTVRDPNAPPDNDFLFGRDDPQGHHCPFGAHVRRANPRDSLNPGDAKEVPIVNRHRLLRRGRPYIDGDKAGLLFMCFNADIERQYEFVQQNWINASSHHGLRNEHDPVASHYGGCGFTMPARTGAPTIVHRPKPFVTVRGGGYFFMPSRSALKYLASV